MIISTFQKNLESLLTNLVELIKPPYVRFRIDNHADNQDIPHIPVHLRGQAMEENRLTRLPFRKRSRLIA